jgi:glutamate dehydrogenase
MNKMDSNVVATEDARAHSLVASAIQLLGGRIPADVPMRMFGRAAPEDLLRYSAAELAQLSANAWMFMAERVGPAPKIRVVTPPFEAGGELKKITVIELINDDKPFLLDSVMGELTDRGIAIRLVAHPVFTVERGDEGRLVGLPDAARGTARRESLIHIHVERIDDEDKRAALLSALGDVMVEVACAVADFRDMQARTAKVIAELKANPPPFSVDEIAEAIQFLEWLLLDNYVFLGFRSDTYDHAGGQLIPGEALGILRGQVADLLTGAAEVTSGVSAEAIAFLNEPRPLVILKSSRRARVHRRAAMDAVLIKHYGPDGELAGVDRLVGLFTSSAYTRSPRGIPYLRRKVAAVIDRAGFDAASHSGRALSNVLDHYPRDELFQIDEDQLFQAALAVMQLEERPRVRVLARRDRFDRFVSVLVYLPRERFATTARTAIGLLVARAYNGRVAGFIPFYPEGPLVRAHFIIAREGERSEPNLTDMERGISALLRTWDDALADALTETHDPVRARVLMEKYGKAFSAGYRDTYTPEIAIADIRVLDGLSAERPLGVTFLPRSEGEEGAVTLKVWSYDKPIPLSTRVPVLEHMGYRVVDESTFHVQTAGRDAPDFWLHDMALSPITGGAGDLAARKSHLEAAFLMVMRGLAEDDGYNALVQAADLVWRDVALLRTLSRYLRQIRVPYSQDYMWATLVKHAGIAADIVRLFDIRFNPEPRDPSDRQSAQAQLMAGIEDALASVESLDEDRIIRHFVNLVQSAVRTNFFQLGPDGLPKDFIAIKFDSHKVDAIPLPRPLYEIFVYSPRVEAIHLRFGKVARGGLRWSDRPQDFRTEILNLAKAQQVKNIVIVPVGAKGGFVPKWLPTGDRDAIQAEGIATYKIFMSALLEISDNIGPDGEIVPPPATVRHDGDDPYLVVAADKGTATFSDIANSVSQEHDFWLDDAYASGGSAGYDHKEMGITARGAWEAVKRHFREMDVDIMASPFTVAGVGDMSGDVFGNGMLCARTTKLVAAFDHRDIFIDPDPDPQASYDERKRLYELPRSSWQDYDRAKISAGGGVYSRSVKEIELSEQAQAVLGFAAAKATPQQVMNAILKAPVDLIYFGGIGTYLRATSETDEAAGDRANDAIRVTAADLRCKVIGEGANLGVTQKARIEAAQRGIRLNNDAVDNSAGVNTSDIEVNLKIALSMPRRDGRLTLDDRNSLLASMTDEVARLVLRNNYQQTLSLTLSERRGMEDLGFQQRLMQILEARHLLDRKIEFLPDDLELTERRRRSQPLTRPELAVLLAYAKLTLYEDLLASSVPDDPYLARDLMRYFPPEVAKRFPDALERHRLRREIIATQLTNSMINRGGSTLVVRIADQTGAAVDKIAAAFATVRNSFDLIPLMTEIEKLDNLIPNKLQTDLFIAVQDLLLDRIVWFLRNVDLSRGLDSVVDHYRTGIAGVADALDRILPEAAQAARAQRRTELVAAGVPETVARRMADLPALVAAPDIVMVADRAGRDVADVAATYYAAGARFQLDRVTAAARAIKVTDYFDRLALDRALDSIGDAERRLAAEIMGHGAGPEAVEKWMETRSEEIDRVRLAVHEIANSGLTLSKLAVAASMLGDLVRR